MMDVITYNQEKPVSSYQESYERACYASEAVVHLLSKEGFASMEVGRLFQERSSFLLRLPRSKEGSSTDDNMFMGAVMAKLAQRGTPAPCSLMVERYILRKAKDTGLLIFEESTSQNGKIKFTCSPLLKDLDLMLRVCCSPELLIDDSEVDILLQKYQMLLEELDPQSAKPFFEKLASALPDKRLALFIVHRCSPGRVTGGESIESNDEMDFLIQIPDFRRRAMLRIAVQLGPSSNCSDKKDGWIVKRFGSMAPSYWESEVRKLADLISYAVSDNVLYVARLLREMPLERRRALQELIVLPIAEAQLTRSVASVIYMGKKGKIAIGNPQNLDLQVVVDAIQESIGALSTLYGTCCSIELHLADESEKPDFEYYYVPSSIEHLDACIAPYPLCRFSSKRSTRLDSSLRPIDSSYLRADSRKALKFFLNNLMRTQEFQEGQDKLIEQILSMQGAIGLLKPSGGKTLAYQLASTLQPGTSLAVVPTTYMAVNQERNLAEIGIHKIKIVAGLQEEQVQDQGSNESADWNEANIVFLGADTLQRPGMRARLEKVFPNRISFLIFKDVHALSEWSYDFQPEYLNAVRCVMDNRTAKRPCIVALTSSSSRPELLDIMNEFSLKNLDYLIQSTLYDPLNVHYELHKANTTNRVSVLVSVLKATLREHGWQGKDSKIPCGLVICTQEDDSKMGMVNLSQSLGSYLGIPTGIFSPEPPKKFLRRGGSRDSWMKASYNALRKFERGELPILICSRDIGSYLEGRGISFILYAGVQISLDELYRQGGRAGQDDIRSSCIVLSWGDSELSGQEDRSNKSDASTQKSLQNKEHLDEGFPGRVVEKRTLVWAATKLRSSFSGRSIGDRICLEMICTEIPTLVKSVTKSPLESERKLLEKALYRLLLLGAIDGWERKGGSFIVTAIVQSASSILSNYKNIIGRYELEDHVALYFPKGVHSDVRHTIVQCGCRLVDYSYNKIKIRKEEDRAKVIQAVKASQESLGNSSDYSIDYAYRSEIKAKLSLDSEAWWRALDDTKGLDELLDLYLVCQREIKSGLDNHALRMIAGFCALAFQDNGQMNLDFVEGFRGFKETHKEAYRSEVIRQILPYAEILIPSKKDLILESLWRIDPSLEISRFCYKKAQPSSEVHYLSLFKLVDGVLEAFKTEVLSNE